MIEGVGYLKAKDFRLDEGEGFAVNFDNAFTGLGGHVRELLSEICSAQLYLAMCDSGCW